MAGHSQFKNIMHRKGAADVRRSKLFSKLATRNHRRGQDGHARPDINSRLRLAIQNARAENMPKDNIERAIKKAIGGDGENYDEIRYEGYGPGGVAMIVEALTDNRNRTAGDVRSLLHQDTAARSARAGSVAFMFDRVGEIHYKPEAGDADQVLEAAIDAGADDVESDDEGHFITTTFADLGEVARKLEDELGEAETVKVVWKPHTTAPLEEDKAETLMKLLAALEDDDDVQAVYSNFEVSDDVMARLTAA